MVFQQPSAPTPYEFGRHLVKECHLVLTQRGSAPSLPVWSTDRFNCLRTHISNVLFSLPAKTLMEYAAHLVEPEQLFDRGTGHANLRDSIRENLADMLLPGVSYEVDRSTFPDTTHHRAPLVTPNGVSFSPNTAPVIRVCTANQVVEVIATAYLTSVSFQVGDLVLAGDVVEPPAENANLADLVYGDDVMYLRVYSMIGRPYLFGPGQVLDRYKCNGAISVYAAGHSDNTVVLDSRE